MNRELVEGTVFKERVLGSYEALGTAKSDQVEFSGDGSSTVPSSRSDRTIYFVFKPPGLTTRTVPAASTTTAAAAAAAAAATSTSAAPAASMPPLLRPSSSSRPQRGGLN